MTTVQEGRFATALAGGVIDPPALGLTFVPGTALSDRGGSDGAALAVARACADANLDFVFVPSWEGRADRIASAAAGTCATPVWVVPGILTPALDEIGIVRGLRATMLEPERLGPALDEALGSALAALERGLVLGAKVIGLADDIAGAGGPLVTPDYIRAELLPRYAVVTAAAQAAGVPAILHCDGDVRMPLSALRGVGFSALHPGGMSDAAFEGLLAEALEAGLRIIGGIMTRDLGVGVPRAVTAGTRARMLARGGGLLLADDGGITTFAEYTALLAAFAAAHGPR